MRMSPGMVVRRAMMEAMRDAIGEARDSDHINRIISSHFSDMISELRIMCQFIANITDNGDMVRDKIMNHVVDAVNDALEKRDVN